MAELIDHAITGYLVGDVDGAMQAVDRVSDLNRPAIRASTVTRFDKKTMVDRYAALYRTVLADRP
jgi:hypothetical protein